MKKRASLSGATKKLIFIAVSVVLFASLLFIGGVAVQFGDTSFAVSATLTSGVEIPYDDVKGILLDTDLEPGRRVFSIGSLRLDAGTYNNDKYGDYKLYAYNESDTYVVLQQTSGDIVAFALEDTAATMEAYETLLDRCDHLAE